MFEKLWSLIPCAENLSLLYILKAIKARYANICILVWKGLGRVQKSFTGKERDSLLLFAGRSRN